MNYSKALEILDIQLYAKECKGTPYTLKYLKRKYHKLALQNHPDKNESSKESNEKFRQINEAYEFLKREIHENENIYKESDNFEDVDENNFENDESTNNHTCYQNILKTFMFDVLQGSYNTIITSIIQEIVGNCKNISFKIFSELNKDTTIEVYSFLSKYKHILHITDEILEKIKEIVVQKCKDDQVYILNPDINDLLGENAYKLDIQGNIYYVPLWHNEVYFDGSGCDIIVKCIPDLPENISIDDENNLIVELNVPFEFSLLDDFIYSFSLGKKHYTIDLRNITLQKVQYLYLKEMGVAKINEMDVYDVSKKADIFLKIRFVEK
jgi:hypothetical protein